MKKVSVVDMGILKGEILEYLEGNGRATMAELTRLLERPSKTVFAVIDALVGQDLVRTTRNEDEVIVERVKKTGACTDCPEVWG